LANIKNPPPRRFETESKAPSLWAVFENSSLIETASNIKYQVKISDRTPILKRVAASMERQSAGL
jgi:hypothetical protein